MLSRRGFCVGLIVIQRSLTECGVLECDREASIMRMPWPTTDRGAIKKNKVYRYQIVLHSLLHAAVIVQADTIQVSNKSNRVQLLSIGLHLSLCMCMLASCYEEDISKH